MIELATEQYDGADNMTDRMAALAALNDLDATARRTALDDFYGRFEKNGLVIDKWFGLEAMSALPGTLDRVKALTGHAAFSIRNPNKVRALIGVFASANPVRFHAKDGAGYTFLADRVIEIGRAHV